MTRGLRLVLAVQAAYYIASGVWPLVHMPSFEAVTGAKTDDWLVHTVGLLLVAIGAAISTAVRRAEAATPTCVLAIGAALALAAIEIVYVTAGTIRSIYLLDAAIEIALAFAIGWLLARARSAR
jgi:hypothetical protein